MRFANHKTLLFVTTVFVITAIQYVQALKVKEEVDDILTDDSNSFTSAGCSPESFANGNTCTLSCSVTPSEPVQYYSADFYYYATDANTNVTFSNHPNFTITKNSSFYGIDLDMDDYWAGYYVCSINVKNFTTKQLLNYQQTFQIEKLAVGILLDDPCMTRQECYALNSECYHNRCQCVGYYHIYSWYNNNNSPACLTPSGYMMPCQNPQQCYLNDPSSGLTCMTGICRPSY